MVHTDSNLKGNFIPNLSTFGGTITKSIGIFSAQLKGHEVTWMVKRLYIVLKLFLSNEKYDNAALRIDYPLQRLLKIEI